MKKLGAARLFGILLIWAIFAISVVPSMAKNIEVYPGESLYAVRDRAKKGDQILLHGGTYRLDKTLVLEAKHSGVTWSSYPGETAIISGGKAVTGWMPYKNGIWKAPLMRKEKLRQLYVNGCPARMAEYNGTMKGQGGYGEFVIKGDEPWALSAGKQFDGVRLLKNEFMPVKNPQDLEVQSQSTWVTNRLCVRDVKEMDVFYALLLEQPFASFLQNQGWGTDFKLRGDLKLFNALEYLDEPGEFYFDRKEQTLYYMPRKHENLTIAEVEAPCIETLVSIGGTCLKKHASNIKFSGIIFQHSAFQMTEVAGSYGTGGTQAAATSVKYGDKNWHNQMYQSTDVPVAAIQINSADRISFEKNIFRLLGSIGINMENDVCDAVVNGNVFQYTGASAINIGHPHHVYIGKQNGENEGHGPYNIDNTNDKWDETVEGLCKRVSVTNNIMRHNAFEHQSHVVICALFGHNITIAYNDIRYAPYTGISLGWAWEEFDGTNERSKGKPTLSLRYNSIHHNRIGNVLQTLHDGGGIYLLAAQEPVMNDSVKQTWTEVYGNYLYDFGGNTRAGMHPDNGSRFVHFYDNVFDNIQWSLIKVSSYARKGDYRINNNYANTELYWSELDLPYSPNTVVKDNIRVHDNRWPITARKIIDESGLQSEYRYLLDGFKD